MTKKTKKMKKGDKYTCELCGFTVTVDEVCGCVDTCDIICCDKPMKLKASDSKKGKK